ncbi:hypothetical protein ACIOKD_36295 [Streptomyces sp. NPDC087844]|uniref:hypothetical protein n=1 Tax=Streptomyces sp. NPDC087844 TaxID=3365805 RepID=UPI0037F44C25
MMSAERDDHRRELRHQPGALVDLAGVARYLIEGEVVEVLDQLRVGHRERGDMAREEPLVCSLGRRMGLAGGHGRTSTFSRLRSSIAW